MSLSIKKNINTVVIARPASSLTITDNRKGTTVSVSRAPDMITVTNLSGLQGPKGETGAQGPAGLSAQTGSFFISASVANAVITFTKGDSTTSSVTVNNIVSASYALTASYALNGSGGAINTSSLATTGSNTFVGIQTFSGSLIPAGPYTDNISQYNLGSATSAWHDLYIGTGTVYFMTGSISASLGFTGDTLIVEGANLLLPTGSGITGSLQGTASYAITASYALNAAAIDTDTSRIVTGSVTASVAVSGDIFLIKSGSYPILSLTEAGMLTISGSASDLFLIKNAQSQVVMRVSQSGVVVLATQSIAPTGTAPNGAIYFTSASFFVGLD